MEVEVLVLISLAMGVVLSLIANTLLSIYGVNLSQPFSYGGMEFRKMVSEVNARSFYLSGITVILSATLVSLFPALRAAHIDPAKAMRMT